MTDNKGKFLEVLRKKVKLSEEKIISSELLRTCKWVANSREQSCVTLE